MSKRKTLKEAKPSKSSREYAKEELREVPSSKVKEKIVRKVALKKDEVKKK